jgi:hypothetical protein
LETYAFPAFGDRPVNEIEGPAIRDVLAPIWLSKSEAARRVRQRIATVLDWACAKGFRARAATLLMAALGALADRRVRVLDVAQTAARLTSSMSSASDA